MFIDNILKKDFIMIRYKLLLFCFFTTSLFSQQTHYMLDDAMAAQGQTSEHQIKFNAEQTQILLDAVRANDVKQARAALAHGANPSAIFITKVVDEAGEVNWDEMRFPEDYSCPVLHYVTMHGWTELLKILANAPGIQIDARPVDYQEEIDAGGGVISESIDIEEWMLDCTALVIAAQCGRYMLRDRVSNAVYEEMVAILLDAGADVDTGDRQYDTIVQGMP